MANYGVVHTSNISGRCYSFVHTADIENGYLVSKGELATGEREIYNAGFDTSAPAFLVANPAWVYDDATYAKKQENAYINVANKAFRVYELNKYNRFKVSAVTVDGSDIAVGDSVGMSATGKITKDATSTFVGKVIAIDTYGFNYNVGSAGQVDTSDKFYLIEVVSNA